MKMKALIALALSLALPSLPSLAQGAGPGAGPDAAAKALLASCDSLVGQAKYLSAYRLLAAVKDPSDYVLAKEIEICVRYFAQSLDHRMFGLVDLKPGETLEGLRKSGGTFTMVALDPAEAVKDYLARHPASGLLYKSLGDYYYDVFLRYEGRWLDSDPEIVKRAIENYDSAFAADSLDARSLGDYAELLLRQGEFARAIPILAKAISLEPSNGNAHYNLAYACLQAKDYARAISEVKLSMDFYKANPSYLADCYILASDASKHAGDYSGALDWIESAAKLRPGDYHVLRDEIPLFLIKGDSGTAQKKAETLFAMAPKNPSASQMIMEGYYFAEKMPELAAFFEHAQKAYLGNDEALGNIRFHYAKLAHDMGEDKKARELLDTAESDFRKVLKSDNEVFKAIADQKAAYGG
jgi:tetratricopeptide (TPR) repeat protein